MVWIFKLSFDEDILTFFCFETVLISFEKLGDLKK
jgi:hypothetical protein